MAKGNYFKVFISVIEIMAIFYTTHNSSGTNLVNNAISSSCSVSCSSSGIKTETRRIIRLEKLTSVMRRSRRTTQDSCVWVAHMAC